MWWGATNYRLVDIRDGRVDIEERSTLAGIWRVKQTHYDPPVRMLMQGPHKEMGVEDFDHPLFVGLAELIFPLISILLFPLPPRLTHLPVSTHQSVALTGVVIAKKIVLKLMGNLL